MDITAGFTHSAISFQGDAEPDAARGALALQPPAKQLQALPPQALTEQAQSFESLRERQVAAGLPRNANASEQARGLRAQMLLQLQRFHDFEYGLRLPRTPAPAPSREAREDQPYKVRADALQRAAGESLSAFSSGIGAPGNFFDDLLALIALIGSQYLDVYDHVVNRYAAMFEAFNERVTAIIADHIKGVDDGKNIEINGTTLRNAIDQVISEFSASPGPGVLYPPNEAGHEGTYADSVKWALALGLTAADVHTHPPYRVMMDLTPLMVIHNSLPVGHAVKWDSARFQAWQTGFNSQESELKNKLQMLTSKYSNANAYHDNFNKVLSAQLSQFAEMLKAYVNF